MATAQVVYARNVTDVDDKIMSAWLWRGGSPSVHAWPPALAPRRSILEHLEASGRLVWSLGGQPHLLARARAAVLRQGRRRNPLLPGLSPWEQAQWLAREAGGDAGAIASALDDRPRTDTRPMVQDLQLLENLRHRLP